MYALALYSPGGIPLLIMLSMLPSPPILIDPMDIPNSSKLFNASQPAHTDRSNGNPKQLPALRAQALGQRLGHRLLVDLVAVVLSRSGRRGARTAFIIEVSDDYSSFSTSTFSREYFSSKSILSFFSESCDQVDVPSVGTTRI
jgi:hypothetical protein